MNYLDLAIIQAEQAYGANEVPVGAVIVLPDGAVYTGQNCKEAQWDPTGHAEIVALRKAASDRKSWRLNGAKLIVTLEPCPMCLAACQQARIEEVLFMAWDPKGGALSLGIELHTDLRTNHRFQVSYQQDERASKLLQSFFKEKRK
jgi:tRNA(adenine34) deaminase